jgi:hypothetical protein
MFSDQFAIELNSVLQAQHHIFKQLDGALSEVEAKLSDVDVQTNQINELERLMSQLEASADCLEAEDFNDFTADEILQLYERRHTAVTRDLAKIGYKDWDSFVRQCQTYSLSQDLDPFAPYEALLTEADFQRLRSESYDAQLEWDKWDMIFVGASGVLASLTDALLVRVPKDSSLTQWLKSYDPAKSDDWISKWIQNLSKTCTVPYDNQDLLDGMYAKSHRLQSLGHDPVLGFIFGVIDILRGTVTGFSYDKITKNHTWACEAVGKNYEPVNLITALLRQIGHLISDVATPMGLPAPFMALFQGINIGSIGEKGHSVGEVARSMYLNGYDLRHFLVSGITPATIEIILRAYVMLRHYSEHGEFQPNLMKHPKYRTMLTAAHGIAATANAGKVVLMQGNPLAINAAEWFAFIRYLIPTLKYWGFDHQRLRLEHLTQINEAGWHELMQNNDRLLEMVARSDSPVITLGN